MVTFISGGFSYKLLTDILGFCHWMNKEGYSQAAFKERAKTLRRIAQTCGALLDGVKDLVSKLGYKPAIKLWVKTYHSFAKWKGYEWEKPRVQDTEPTLLFISLERELDSLIAGARKKLATFLLALEETGQDSNPIKNASFRGVFPILVKLIRSIQPCLSPTS